MCRNEEEEIKDASSELPHVVILGAGASLAALPYGDKNGKKLPIMNDLIEVVGLEPLLEEAGLNHQGENFEVIYSSLSKEPDKEALVQEIEKAVFDYFVQLQLPDEPTLYDHLVLSLRDKDVIATFNWDPFLIQAYQRNTTFTASLPHMCFLHGSVALGYCAEEHDKQVSGLRGHDCGICNKPLIDSRLLYPVEQKGYANDPFIDVSWRDLKYGLKNAYMLTIFGYGAPKSDVEAIELMKEAWGSPEQRAMEQIEIINILDPEELERAWSDFIHTHHYGTCSNFYDSFIARHPRRTIESLRAQNEMVMFLTDRDFQNNLRFPELWGWLSPWLKAEQNIE